MRYFLGSPDATQRVKPSGRVPRRCRVRLRLKISFRQTGVDVAGANAVHANALFAVVNCHCLGQPDDAGFGGAIAGAARFHEVAVH